MYKNSTEMTHLRKEFYLGYSFISILKISLGMTKLLLLNLFIHVYDPFYSFYSEATVSCWRKNTTWVFIWCIRSCFFLCSASEDMIVTCSEVPAVSSNEVQRKKAATQSQVKDCKCYLFQNVVLYQRCWAVTDGYCLYYGATASHFLSQCICTAKSGVTTGPC